MNTGCREYRTLSRVSRRDLLRVGVLGGLGVSLPTLLRRQAEAAAGATAKAKSVILLWLQGGVSHHDTFDMKPDAPADIRGELSPISTNLPGYYVSELMPRLATMIDKLAIVRSAVHNEGAHERGSMYMVEGRRPPQATGVQASGHPQLGSIVGHQLGMRGGLPPFVSVPGNDFTSRFIGPGYLPGSAEAFKGSNAQSLAMPAGFSESRFAGRLELRESLASLSAHDMSQVDAGQNFDRFHDQAIDIITSARAAAAFDIDDESEATKRLYGLYDAQGKEQRRRLPEYCLIARRLVEAGVRFVTIGRDSWDHHSNLYPQLRSRVPRFDAALAGLITDLEQRGLLDDTLVVYLTEFGRTPKINGDAGRDHWPNAFSIALAGAGIKTGQVLGASDARGAEVVDFPVWPEQVAATVLHLVGIDPQTIYLRQDGRPMHYVDSARPVPELLA